MERLATLRHIAFAILFSLILFGSGLCKMDAQASADWITVAGESYFHSCTMTNDNNKAIQSGTVIYNTETDSLTLINAQIYIDGDHYGISIQGGIWVPDLWFDIYLIGDNSIKIYGDSEERNDGIYMELVQELRIHGPGSLTISTNSIDGSGIYSNDRKDNMAAGNLRIDEGATVSIIGWHDDSSYGINLEYDTDQYGTLTVQDSTLIVGGNVNLGVKALRLVATNSVVNIAGKRTGMYADGGYFPYQKCEIVDSTVTISGGECALSMAGVHSEKLTLTGGSELTLDGYFHALQRGMTEKSITLNATDANPMKLEAGPTEEGREQTYTATTNLNIDHDFKGEPLTEYGYLHISAEGAMDVQAALQLDVPAGEAAPSKVEVWLGKGDEKVGDSVFLTAEQPTQNIPNVPKRVGSTYHLNYTLYDAGGSQIEGDGPYHVNVVKKAAGSYQITVCGSEQHYDMDVTAIVKPASGAGVPDSIELTLRSKVEGEAPRTMTLTAADNWKGTFRDLLETNKGQYTLEVTAINGGNGGYESETMIPDSVYGLVFISGGYVPDSGSSTVVGECHHEYEWEVYKEATATEDGEMRYRCKYCGDVQYSVPVTAYYTFNKETQEKIIKAEQNATVKVQTPWFISFHEMVYKALQERPDVTLVVDYKNEDALYEMTIPAGSGDQLQGLFGDSQFAGFLYLGGTYATTELPDDTVFDGLTATEMWFGTTTAH